jgi:tyrosyl-DNA phosphodiesterase-1
MKRSRESTEKLTAGFHVTALPGREGITLYDILEGVTATAQFNYMVDLDWFMGHVAPGTNVMVVHGHRNDLDALKARANHYNVRIVTPNLPIAYGTFSFREVTEGTHHTKLMVLFYGDASARIVVHTANLIRRDWRYGVVGGG